MTNEKTAGELKQIYKSLSWQLLEVTENAAIAAARAAGQGNKNLADAAAVDAMRYPSIRSWYLRQCEDR